MMVTNPLDQLAPLAEAGADRLIFHLEAAPEPQGAIERTRELGCEAGIAISPPTPASSLEPWVDALDMVTVMLVHPGRGGQELLVDQLPKVGELRRMAEAAGASLVSRGGRRGQGPTNASMCVEAGATLLVAGSAVYNDRETPAEAIAGLHAAIGRTAVGDEVAGHMWHEVGRRRCYALASAPSGIAGLPAAMRLSCVRRQRVQTLTRRMRPSMSRRLLWTFGRNSRFVRGALRSQRPECLWRMLRPETSCASGQRSHLPEAIANHPRDERNRPLSAIGIKSVALSPKTRYRR